MPSSTNDRLEGISVRTTQWSLVRAARAADPVEAASALEELCRIYWPAVYAFIKSKGHAPPDASDLTQGFFMHLLSGNFLRYIDPKIGKFRSYLLRSVQNYLSNEWARSRSQRRGGNLAFISWEQLSDPQRAACEPFSSDTPERAFEREWIMALVRSAFDRLTDTIAQCPNASKLMPLRHYLVGKEEKSYSELAATLGMTTAAVKAAVYRLRIAFRGLLREEVAKTLGIDEPVDEELRDLLRKF